MIDHVKEVMAKSPKGTQFGAFTLEKADDKQGERTDPVALKLDLGLYSRPAAAAGRTPSRPRPTGSTGDSP